MIIVDPANSNAGILRDEKENPAFDVKKLHKEMKKVVSL